MTCFNRTNATANETFPWDVSRAIFDCILISLVIVTNLGILVLVARRWCREGMPVGNVTSSILVINLSAADFLVGVMGVFHFLPRYVCGLDEFFATSQTLCILRFQPVIGAHLGSGYTLIAIAVDRYIAVCHAINYRDIVTPRRSLLVIALIWPLAIANSMILFFWNNFDGRDCTEGKVLPIGFTLLIGISGTIIIMATVTWAHWNVHRVVQELRRRARQGREGRMGAGCVIGGLFAVTTAPLDARAAHQERTGTRAARVLIIILCVYLASWQPFLILIIVRSLDVYIPEVAMETASSIVHFNYLVNPFIYAYNNRPIRKAIKTCLQNMRKKKYDFWNESSTSVSFVRT